MLHVICIRLRPSHLGVRVGDSSRRSEEIVKKNLELRVLNANIFIIIIIITTTTTTTTIDMIYILDDDDDDENNAREKVASNRGLRRLLQIHDNQ